MVLVEVAGRELRRLRQFVRGGGHIENPDVLVALGIVITLTIAAIDSARDEVDIRLMLALRLALFGLVGVLGGLSLLLVFAVFSCPALLACFLLEVLGEGGAEEGDALAVG